MDLTPSRQDIAVLLVVGGCPPPSAPAAVYCRLMAREPILQPPVEFDDEDRDLRPQRMRDMVGQREVYARLEIAVDAASKRGEPLGHILFDGPPGLGKTTFATCIPRDLGVSVPDCQRRGPGRPQGPASPI